MPRGIPRTQPSVSAPAVHSARRGTTMVIVACKLGIARFELQLCTKRTVTEQTQAGPRDVDQWFKTGQTWIVRGTAYPEGTPPKGYIKRPEEVLGYSLTRGIPKDFFDAWLEQHRNDDMVKNRLIYACDTYEDIEAIATDFRDMKCGLSPLDMPSSASDRPDSRVPAPIDDKVSVIEPLSV